LRQDAATCHDDDIVGDLELGRPAVEPPIPPDRGARIHRRLTGLSGILLFACMFLPAVRGCHEPVTPLQVPPFLPPYLYGLVFALIVMSRRSRGLPYGVIALRVLAALVVLGSVVLVVIVPLVGIIELVIGAVLMVTVGLSHTTEARVAVTGVAIGLFSMIWFGIWSLSDDALIGVYLSLASSAGLFAGCLAWLRALVVRPPVVVPRAVAVARPPTGRHWQ
jgi:hypothetical protein